MFEGCRCSAVLISRVPMMNFVCQRRPELQFADHQRHRLWQEGESDVNTEDFELHSGLH